jgi:hypothetical protein
MPDMSFDTIRVDDARITKVVLDGTTLFLSIRDWQGKTMVLVFRDVIGVKGYGIVNVDLGAVSESSSDAFIEEVCSVVDEPVNGFQCYSLISAWNDRSLVKIVARSWELSSAMEV